MRWGHITHKFLHFFSNWVLFQGIVMYTVARPRVQVEVVNTQGFTYLSVKWVRKVTIAIFDSHTSELRKWEQSQLPFWLMYLLWKKSQLPFLTNFCQARPGHRLPISKLHQVRGSPDFLRILRGEDLQEHHHKGRGRAKPNIKKIYVKMYKIKDKKRFAGTPSQRPG